MMKKATIFKFAGMLILAVALVSCNGLKKMAKNYNDVNYEITPQVLEANGGKVSFTVKGTIPPKYFNKKAAVLIQPVLTYQGGELQLAPVLLKGEKVEGDGTTVSYTNGGTFTYSQEFEYDPKMYASELMVNAVAFQPKKTVSSGLTMAEAMKMPKALNLGEEKIADGIIATSTRIDVQNEVRGIIQIGDENPQTDASGNIRMDAYQVAPENEVDMLYLAPHGYEKVTIITEMANIYFPQNIDKWLPNHDWNKKKEVMKQLETLNTFVAQGWVIRDMEIDGWASPEGEETFNEGLSERRSVTASNVVFDNFQKLARKKDSQVKFKNPKDDINLKRIGHGPDWNGFLQEVESSTIADKRPILNVVKSSDPDKREQEIRNMIMIYPELQNQILPPLRRAEIKVNAFEPKKTDDEIARLSTSEPTKLSIEELLYAATLTDDWNTQYAIYKAAVQNYSQSWEANNNAGVVALKMGKADEAMNFFNKANQLKANNGMVMNNLGVVYAYNDNWSEAETHFMNANKMGVDNNYNLALIDMHKGGYKTAITKFGNTKCNYNLALAQVLSGNNSAATTNLECARKNADTYYLMAIVGARTGDTNMMNSNLKKAIKADPKMKAEAKADREFIKYFTDPDFMKVVE
jgi:Tfp pilus assembly protein PilF/outer membrane protein OmpA-like peptidoglycan-associated protein